MKINPIIHNLSKDDDLFLVIRSINNELACWQSRLDKAKSLAPLAVKVEEMRVIKKNVNTLYSDAWHLLNNN